MRIGIGLAAIVLCLAGCGTAPNAPNAAQQASPNFNPNFPEVTDRMREACVDWFPTDAGIANTLHGYGVGRRDGVTEAEMSMGATLIAMEYFPGDPDGRAAYSVCMHALIHEAYH